MASCFKVVQLLILTFLDLAAQRVSPIELEPFSASSPGEDLPGLEVSLNINGKPSVGESVGVCVTVTNRSSRPRVLEEHVNAQVKDYNSSPQESFWTLHQEVHIQPHGGKESCNPLGNK